MQMIMLVLDNPDQLDAVLDAWYTVGVSGVTIVETSGLHRRKHARLVGARYAFGLGKSGAGIEVGHYTLFAIVPNEDAVRACIAAAERIVGDLDAPKTGVLAAWDLTVVKGVPNRLQPGD